MQKSPIKRNYILHKIPIILRSLLIVAIAYVHSITSIYIHDRTTTTAHSRNLSIFFWAQDMLPVFKRVSMSCAVFNRVFLLPCLSLLCVVCVRACVSVCLCSCAPLPFVLFNSFSHIHTRTHAHHIHTPHARTHKSLLFQVHHCHVTVRMNHATRVNESSLT